VCVVQMYLTMLGQNMTSRTACWRMNTTRRRDVLRVVEAGRVVPTGSAPIVLVLLALWGVPKGLLVTTTTMGVQEEEEEGVAPVLPWNLLAGAPMSSTACAAPVRAA
jgi:hypothetical protein